MKRRSKYRKHVEASILEELPEPAEDEQLVIVIAHRGGNLVEVKPINPENDSSNSQSLCLLPSKFRKLVWVKRGTIMIVKKANEDYETSKKTVGKVIYAAEKILFHNQVKHLLQKKILCQEEIDKAIGNTGKPLSSQQDKVQDDEDVSDELDGVFVNRNRQRYVDTDSDSSGD